ncbi:MAG: ATP-binding cassette domain-containing protein [Pirellulales bacterium]
MSTCCYRLHGVSVRHGPSFALDVGELEIPAGEVFCLVGPTGAGKSTLLRLLSLVQPVGTGQVHFFDQRLNGQMPLAVERRVTMVFQRPLLLSGTVRRSIEYALRLRGAAGPRRVDEVLDRLGLTELASQSTATLSGGQTQLVALARALVIEPEVLLLDEPTANLDPARVALVEEAVGQANRQRRMTVVWATHNLFQARRVAGRVGLLWEGKLIEVAPPEPFFKSPRAPRPAAVGEGKLVY